METTIETETAGLIFDEAIRPAELLQESPNQGDPEALLGEFRSRKTAWDTWIFVGCGGNYFYLRPLLEVAAQDAKQLTFVDPDRLEPKNAARQWPNREMRDKPDVAYGAWPGLQAAGVSLVCERIENVSINTLMGGTRRKADGLMIVCLPDNDKARIDSIELAHKAVTMERAYAAGIIIAGTAEGRGQALWGLCVKDTDGARWAYDPFSEKQGTPDLQDDGGRDHTGCGQRPLDNFYTALCAAECLQEIIKGEDTNPHEVYWYDRGNHVRIWRKPLREPATDTPTE